MLDADVGLVVGVTQLTYRVGGVVRHRRGREEVVRRGTRRLEVEAFHRGDAAVGPERQQHQRHRRSVFAVADPVAIVDLPQRPAAAVVGVGAEAVHRLHEVVVLGVQGLGLVTAEVVRRPSVAAHVAGAGVGADRAPGVLVADLAAARQHLEGEAEDEQDDGADPTGEERSRTDAGDLASGSVAQPVDQRPADLGGTDHHHQVAHQIHPRQHPRVPQQADDREAVAGQVHHGHGDQAGEAEGDPVHVAPDDDASRPAIASVLMTMSRKGSWSNSIDQNDSLPPSGLNPYFMSVM